MGAFFPADSEAPASNYALLNSRNGHPTLEYDAAAEWATNFTGVLPRNYGGGGLTVTVHWMGASATSGDVKWGGSIERDNANNHDLDADAYATEQTATGTANGTSGKVTSTAITFTDGANVDSLAAGDPFRLKLARKAADGADTMTGNAQLIAITVVET